MIITLPFPPSILRPNDKTCWQVKNPVKVAYREQCKSIALQNIPKFNDGNISIHIKFYPPNNRWDYDAMLSAFKSGQDGMCMAWGINDKRLRPVLLDPQDADKLNPRVEIFINEKRNA